MNEQDLGCRLLEVQMNRLLHTAQFSLQFSFLFNNLVFLHVNWKGNNVAVFKWYRFQSKQIHQRQKEHFMLMKDQTLKKM